MQNYSRLYEYIHEYQRLVHDYYSKHGIAFLVTYYNIDSTNTVWDDENLLGGSYERIGNLTGMKFRKILNLPVYWIDEIQSIFDGQQIGYIKEGASTLVFPSTYGFTPYPGDFIKFEQSYMRPTNDTYPIYVVGGVEKSSNTDRVFWKTNIQVRESIKTTEIDPQVTDVLSFVDYDKKIHRLDDAASITRLLLKNTNLSQKLKNLYDSNSGFYFLSN